MKLNPQEIRQCLSAYPLFECADEIEETCSRVGQVFRPHALQVVGKQQRLQAHMDHFALKEVTINRLLYQAEVNIHSEPLADFYLVMLPLSATALIRCGSDSVTASPHVAAIVNSETELAMRWDRECDQLIFRINKSAVDRICSAHLGHPVAHPVRFGMALDLQLSAACGQIVSMLTSSSDITRLASASPLVAAHLEQLLISTMLMSHDNQYREEITNPEMVVTPHYVRRAEEYMAEHAADPLTMKDVAVHTGISLRSLYAGFERYRKHSPKTFLRNMRLDLAHADLTLAVTRGTETTITDVALARGFTHLGNFTKAYSLRFGEKPSETLRKRR